MPSNFFWAASALALIIFLAGVIKEIRGLSAKERIELLYKVSQASGTTAIMTGVVWGISKWLGSGYYPETIIAEVKTMDVLVVSTLLFGVIGVLGLLDWLWRGMPMGSSQEKS